jgi:hypothetical protein
VTITARNLERLKQAAAKLGRGVQAAQLDVTDDKAVEQFFEREAPWRHVVVSGSSVRFGPFFVAYATNFRIGSGAERRSWPTSPWTR